MFSFRTDLAAYSELGEAVADWHRAVIWSTWMCRCGRSSAVVLPEDEGNVCDYARLVLEVLWCIAIPITIITIPITIRTAAAAAAAKRTARHNTKEGSSGTVPVDHSAEDGQMGWANDF